MDKMANKETSSHLIPSQKSTRVDRITTHWPERKIWIRYAAQGPNTSLHRLRHIIHVMSWGEQDPVSIRTRLHVPYFAESFFFHRLFQLSHATSSSFLSLFFFLFPFFFGPFNSVNLEGIWQLHGLIIIINST